MHSCTKCGAAIHPAYAATGGNLCEECWTDKLAALRIDGTPVSYSGLQAAKEIEPKHKAAG